MKTLLYEGRPLMVVGTTDGTAATVRTYSVDPAIGALTALLSSYTLPTPVAAFHLKHI